MALRIRILHAFRLFHSTSPESKTVVVPFFAIGYLFKSSRISTTSSSALSAVPITIFPMRSFG
jgi:hypothetical protein